MDLINRLCLEILSIKVINRIGNDDELDGVQLSPKRSPAYSSGNVKYILYYSSPLPLDMYAFTALKKPKTSVTDFL